MRRLILLCCFMHLVCLTATAQQFRFTSDKFSSMALSDTIALTSKPATYYDDLPVVVYDQWASYLTFMSGSPVLIGNEYEFKSIQDVVRVGVVHNNLHVGAYRYKVTLDIQKYTHLSPNVPASVVPVELELNYNPDSLKPYQDLAVLKFSGCLKFKVVLTGVYDLNAGGVPLVSRSSLAKNFFIESEIATQRVNNYSGTAIPECSTPDGGRTLHVAWQCLWPNTFGSYCKLSDVPATILMKPMSYELEWQYIDDYDVNISSFPPTVSYKFGHNAQINYDFRRNSTRIQTNQLSYDIPLLYEHGAVIFRVRTVRPLKDSGYKDNTYGNWSLPESGVVTVGSSCFPGQGYVIQQAHANDSLNWQYTINFAEEGKFKHVINYFDGALKDRQTQTKINTNQNSVIVVDKAFDYEGRPVLQTLPVPVAQSNLAYRPDIALNSATGRPYGPQDLDKPGCSSPDSLAPVSAAAMAAAYYSPQNTDTAGMQKYVPDANGYPFVQSIYSPDNTNKILWQGGAGRDFQPWKGHATRNEYVRAEKDELNRVLGTEAGTGAYYPKQVITDPNGQTTISIFNPAGKVIATGMVGTPDTAASPIDLLPEYKSAELVWTDVLDGNPQVQDRGLLRVDVPYYSEIPSNAVNLVYAASVPAFPAGCGKYLWTDVSYDVKITTDCGVAVAGHSDTLGKDSVLSTNTAMRVVGDTSNAYLQKGRYTISKTLRVSEDKVKDQIRSFVAANEPACFHDDKYFVRKAVEAADFPCINPAEVPLCDYRREQMLKELYPGAKYGQYGKDADGRFLDGWQNSIFSPIDSYYIKYENQSYGNFPTGVDDNYLPLADSATDTHWDFSKDSTNWLPCTAYYDHPWWQDPAHRGKFNDLSNPWIGTNNLNDTGWIMFRTHIAADLNTLNKIRVHFGGDFGPTFTRYYVNGIRQPNPSNWDDFIPATLISGTNELWFAVYNNSGPIAVAATITGEDSIRAFRYRYQAQCLDLPDTIVHAGTSYAHLDSIDVNNFIALFNDTVASALLPLHPEYCRLGQCEANGAFEKELRSYETFQQGAAANRFVLDSIAVHDPIYINADAGVKAATLNDLLRMKNFRRLDSIAIEMAYCSGGNGEEIQHCISYMYSPEIASFTFLNDTIKQAYYSTLRQLYIANRGMKLQQFFDPNYTSCPSCAPMRMNLQGSPVFPQTTEYSYAGFSDPSLMARLPQWMDSAFNRALNNDTTGKDWVMQRAQDSLNTVNPLLCEGQIDAVISGLVNCTLDTASHTSGHPLYSVRSFLRSRCGQSNGDQFTPQTIDSALTAASLPKNDLCHAFLVTYGLFKPETDVSSLPFSCGDSALYADLRQFLNRSDIRAAITGATSFTAGSGSSGLSLSSSNAFESRLIAAIGSTFSVEGFSQTLPAATAGATEFVKLQLLGTDTVTLYLRSKEYSGATQLNGQSAISFTDAFCINNDIKAIAQGAVARNTAIVRATTGAGTFDYFVWSREIPLMNHADAGSIADAVTCLDLKRAMLAMYADSATYHFDATFNHPLYSSTLSNYLNYKLQKKFTYADYVELMKGCAITDQIVVNRYLTMYDIVFTSHAAAQTFLATLSNPLGLGQPSWQISEYLGQAYVWLDFSAVPKNQLLYYKNLVDNYPGGSVVRRNYRWRPGVDVLYTEDTVCAGIWISSTWAYSAYANQVQLGEPGASAEYKSFYVTTNGSTPKAYADAIDHVRTAIAGQCPSSVFVTERELLRSDDYNTPAKQQYLSYIYGLGNSSHDAVIAAVSPASLKANLSEFSGKAVTYDDPICANSKRDLYLYTPQQGSHRGYHLTDSILRLSSVLFPSANATSVNGGLRVFRKAGGDYWYCYFDAANNMYNLHLSPPKNSTLALSSYVLDSVRVAQGSDSSRFFTAYVHHPSFASVRVACPGYTSYTTGRSQRLSNVILLDRGGDDICLDTSDCERGTRLIAEGSGHQAYLIYNDSLNRTLSAKMVEYIVSNTKDSLKFGAYSQKYHYTLYYYDRAGNLTRTVPPAGIKPVAFTDAAINVARNASDSVTNSQSKTAHKKVTTYQYNAQNQLIYQNTPDAGSTFFFYNPAGNLIFSQNSRQRPEGMYSYVLYDGQERPIETGEVKLGCEQPNGTGINYDTTQCHFPSAYGFNNVYSTHPPYMYMSAWDFYPSMSDSLRKIVRTKARRDVVVTTYDTMALDLGALAGEHLSTPENLTHRVSCIAYYPKINANYLPGQSCGNPRFSSYYSYDLNGNVATVTYDYRPLAGLGQRYKRVDYDYDLVSGKVNMLSYNRGRPDQFYQRYEYDADNRITLAESSSDGLIWNKDARYSYYLHGPLSKVQLGDAQIQSLEYAYTIQGWLKAINGDVLRPDLEMGHNGVAGDLTYAKDVIAHALSYYDGDYKSISNTPVTQLPNPAKGLYNGNIAQQTTAIGQFGAMQRSYRYDQLQRLKLTGNAMVNQSNLTVASPSNIYKSSYAYDRDGNITSLARWDGASTQIDNFSYDYWIDSATNRLLSVRDAAPATAGSDLQPGQTMFGNYTYDRTGNLTADNQAHQQMEWTSFGKLRKVTNTSTGQVTTFDYDGKGNRIYKETRRQAGGRKERLGEYYVRDEGGNTLAVYRKRSSYSEEELLKTLLNQLQGAAPASVFAAFVSQDLAANGAGFGDLVQQQAISEIPTWADSVTESQPVSWYIGQDPQITSMILSGTDTWMDPMRSFSTTSPSYADIYSSALTQATTGGGGGGASPSQMLQEAMTVGQGPAEAVIEQYDTWAPSWMAQPYWSMYGASYMFKPGPPNRAAINAANLYSAATTPPMGNPGTMMPLSMNFWNDLTGLPATPEVDGFWRGVIDNNAVFQDPALMSTGSPWQSTLTQVMINNGNATQLADFMDWWVDGRMWLNTNTALDTRLNLIYNTDQPGFIEDYVARRGTQAADKIAGITVATGLTLDDVLNLLNGSSTGITTYSASMVAGLTSSVNDSFSLAEHHIYGSARLGAQHYDSTVLRNVRDYNDSTKSVKTLNQDVVWYSYWYGEGINKGKKVPWNNGDTSMSLHASRKVGYRSYELSDHLGNVLATVLDRKTGVLASGSSTLYDRWKADVTSLTDYYPFGMQMPGRSYEASIGLASKFGFNGKQKDDEISGKGNVISYEFRTFDSRLGRFMSHDPREKEYAWQSTYAYYRNSPISTIDYLGMGDYYTKSGAHLGSDGKTVTGKNGKAIPDNKAYVADSKNTDGTFSNATELSVSNSVLNQYANTVAEESSGNRQESYALASTIANLAKYKHKSISGVLSTEGIYGYGNGGNSTSYENNAEYSMEAAINALTGGPDLSNGALRWDGFDFAKKEGDHIKATNNGLYIAAAHLQTFRSAYTYSPANRVSAGVNFATSGSYKGMVLYRSTAAYGGTIFWGANGKDFGIISAPPTINGFTSDRPCVELRISYPNKGFTGSY